MCVTRTEAKKEQAITEGEWLIKGNKYKVTGTGFHYLASCGDSTTEYYTLEGGGLITKYAFEKFAKRPAPRPELFVTYGQLLAAGPCPDGLLFIKDFAGLGAITPGQDLMFVVTTKIINKGVLSNAIAVKDLYHYRKSWSIAPLPDSWLRFVAEVLNLVPKGMHHDRDTLLRLLGVFE